MCLSAYLQWKLTNEQERISAVIVNYLIDEIVPEYAHVELLAWAKIGCTFFKTWKQSNTVQWNYIATSNEIIYMYPIKRFTDKAIKRH